MVLIFIYLLSVLFILKLIVVIYYLLLVIVPVYTHFKILHAHMIMHQKESVVNATSAVHITFILYQFSNITNIGL